MWEGWVVSLHSSRHVKLFVLVEKLRERERRGEREGERERERERKREGKREAVCMYVMYNVGNALNELLSIVSGLCLSQTSCCFCV